MARSSKSSSKELKKSESRGRESGMESEKKSAASLLSRSSSIAIVDVEAKEE